MAYYANRARPPLSDGADTLIVDYGTLSRLGAEAMRQTSFALRLLTPAFIAGADPQHAELRAPSLRGALRFWLRAAAGGAVGTDGSSLEELRALEAATFGSTAAGSTISLRLDGVRHAYSPPRPSTPGARASTQASGTDYLFWSMVRRGSQSSIAAGTEFTLHLAQPRRLSADDSVAFERALGALWLLVHLGGIGARSRRGAGSLCVVRTDGDPPPIGFTSPASAEAVRTHLHDGLAAIRSLVSTGQPRSFAASRQRLAPFDVLAPGVSRVWVLLPWEGSWPSAQRALDALGNALREGRQQLPLNARAIFGLPIVVRQGHSLQGRRASPFLFRIAALGEPPAGYVAVATLFKSLPVGSANHASDHNMAAYRPIEEWIEEAFPAALEVPL